MTTSHRHRTRRRLAATAVSVLAAVSLAACGSGGSSGPGTSAAGGAQDGKPVPGGRLKIAFWSDFQACIDPNQVYWIESRSIDRNLADSLTDQDPKTGKIVPWLATSWTVNPDATSYTFKLRNDVTFSDGTKLDATAVKTAYDGLHDLGAKSTLGLTYLAGYKSTTVVDPFTVKVDFATPNAGFLQATSTTTTAILSPATYKETPEARCAGKIVGSGEFTLDSYSAGKSVKLTKRAGYAWPSSLITNKGEAYLDGIDVSYIAEDNVRVGSLTSGTIDIAWPRQPITSADQEVIKASGGTIQTRALPGIIGLLVPNVTAGRPLADLQVRKALYKALDLPSYAKTVYWDGYPVAKSSVTSTTPYAADQSAKLAYDPTGAGKLLDTAGWALGSDGYRHKDGKKLTLTFLTNAAGPGEQLVQDQLKKVGIDYQIKVVTAAQLTPTGNAGDWDLSGGYLTRADPSVLGSTLDQAVSKSYQAKYSQDPATGAKISALFAKGLSTVDPDKRAAAYQDLQDALIDNGVAFPLYDRLQTAGVSAKVHGFAWTSESFLRANDIWLSK
ncbi:ABC transporter substrate-binding protein [Frankia sp. QA3]|uniref:ABC transporter substrate-binding protein n=1 Tax=Frankia sp. QA3 TaxID=710111 RepID=UPI000269BDC5|nr:ABC transporter substrate-binding protein [Frankia sp. QA3]EIV92304.1 ABC-type dipeptide transport system, periplasmic component [Frankia sp. QA3]